MYSGFKIDPVLFAKMLQFPGAGGAVEEFRKYLIQCVADTDQPPVAMAKPEPPKAADRGPGRPLKYGHPAYTEQEFKAIREMIGVELDVYPYYYTSKDGGKYAKGLAKEQPDDETVFALDNGVELHYSQRIPFVEGAPVPQYPPSVIGGP